MPGLSARYSTSAPAARRRAIRFCGPLSSDLLPLSSARGIPGVPLRTRLREYPSNRGMPARCPLRRLKLPQPALDCPRTGAAQREPPNATAGATADRLQGRGAVRLQGRGAARSAAGRRQRGRPPPILLRRDRFIPGAVAPNFRRCAIFGWHFGASLPRRPPPALLGGGTRARDSRVRGAPRRGPLPGGGHYHFTDPARAGALCSRARFRRPHGSDMYGSGAGFERPLDGFPEPRPGPCRLCAWATRMGASA